MYNQGFVPSYAFGNQQGPGSMFGSQPQIGAGNMKNNPTGQKLKRPGLIDWTRQSFNPGGYSPYPPIGLPPGFSHGIQ